MVKHAEELLREEIIAHLKELQGDSETVTREQLWNFQIRGKTLRLIDWSRGIRNPKELDATLTIMSNPKSQYDDAEVDGSLFGYAYREGSSAGDNTKLRRAFELKLPLILLRKVSDGVFVPVSPVYVVADDAKNRQFLIALDQNLQSVADPMDLLPIERKYAERAAKQRLHQPVFRARVLRAYESRCTVCRLAPLKLLDAAHIIADNKENGGPTVDNGLCLCKLHHAAYDANYLGIRPDRTIVISQRLLDDPDDSQMLQFGLQARHEQPLYTPMRSKKELPSPDRLAERFAEFVTSEAS
ncbi:HNH endonuclease [Nocardia sp. NPDC056000]|uniref:HNH endonuclease n=1 Tax=Nocardia sp. NPDC056000 TaxID=3345674 RepID=UPI0035DADE6A